MASSDISKENTKAIFNLIVSDNESLLEKIKKEYSKLSVIQIHTTLLLKLGYTFKEIHIILGIANTEIAETYSLLKDFNP